MPRKNPWKTLSSRIAWTNPWFDLRVDRVVRPDGTEGTYSTVLAPTAVGVVPCFDDGSVLLVGQYRYSIERYSWEIPEGGARPGESPRRAARRELREETGYRATRLTSLGVVHTSNCFTNEVAHLFVARGLTIGEPAPDPTEEIVSKRVALDTACRMALDGRMTDSISIVALWRLTERGRPPG